MTSFDEMSQQWAQEELKKAVDVIVAAGVFQGARIEARVAWAMNNAVVIGQIRENIDKASFRWLVTGNNVPMDHVQGDVAATPREALRHFCLKWQLGAEKVIEASRNDPETGEHYRAKANELIKQAEDLYELVEADSLWQ